MSMLGMSGAIPMLPTTPSWRGHEQIYPTSICALLIIWKLSRPSFWNTLFKRFFRTIAKQKHLLISSCPSPRPVCPHISLRSLSEGFTRNLIKLGTPTIVCRETPNLVKMGQEYRALYFKTYVSFTVARDLTRHNRIVVQHSVFLYCWGWHVSQKQTQNMLSPFHCNKGYSNAAQCFALLMSPKFYGFWGRRVWDHLLVKANV
jgi:hypothetical protein